VKSSNEIDVLAPLRCEVSGPELGRILGLTGRRILQLADEGVIERAAGGGFDLVDGVQSYLRYLRGGRDDLGEVVRREVARVLAGRGDR
jgi:hypothetical protein